MQKKIFWEKIADKENMKKDFIKITFFISLYENFKKNWEERILSFYANTISFDKNNKPIYEFTMENHNNLNALEENDLIKDKTLEEEYNREVYRTIKKYNGKEWDREASLFNWIYSRGFITQNHYKKLLEIRNFRNVLVHELDIVFFEGDITKLNELLYKLIDIRKYASKRWYFNVELATCGDIGFDEQGNVLFSEEFFDSSNMMYDIIYDVVLK